MSRSPLKKGNRYQYKGYPSGFVVEYVAFRGHPEDDGAAPGVALRWIGPIRGRGRVFIPCQSDAEFFGMLIFANAFDPTPKEAKPA